MMSFLNIFPLLTFAVLAITGVVHAKFVHFPNVQGSIAQYKVISTWDNAKRHCDSQGSILASPINKELLDQMKLFIGRSNYYTSYFIGIRARNENGSKFISEEGILLEDITTAAINMIDKIDPLTGECLSMDLTAIRVVSCTTRLPYLCYKQHSTTPTTDTPDSETTEPTIGPWIHWTTTEEGTTRASYDCGLGYERYRNGHCYKFHNYMLTSWHDANRTCSSEGAYLAIINNRSEARLIKEIVFLNNSPFTFIWIGLHDVTGNNNWRSVHGEYLNVLYNVGDLQNSRYDCGAIKYTGKLYDMYCGDSKSFICEKS